MVNNLDATTPQLKVVDRLFEAYRTCDINKVTPILSKNYTYKAFPKLPKSGDQTKEEHLAFFGLVFARVVKIEVHIRHRGAQFEFP